MADSQAQGPYPGGTVMCGDDAFTTPDADFDADSEPIDHDVRMQGIAYKNVVHFTSLTNEQTDGAPWQWERQNTGSLTAASGGSIVSSPASPNDPVAGSSLQVSAQSAGTGTSAVRFFAQ